MHMAMSGFCIGGRDLNSGPCACVADTLLTESSPQLHEHLFLSASKFKVCHISNTHLFILKIQWELGVVAYACNPSTCENRAGGLSQVWPKRRYIVPSRLA